MPVLPPFLDPAEALARYGRGELLFIDARSEQAYTEAHLPGAVSLPARSLNPPSGGVRQRIAPEALEARAAELGIGADPLVIYGARGGADAAHVWWTLHAHGHPAAGLLDGGIELWQTRDLPLTAEAPPPPAVRTPFAPRFAPEAAIDSAELLARLDDSELILLDTRAASEFLGEDIAGRRGGHIPGALLRPWNDSLDIDGRLQPERELRRVLAAAFAAPEVAVYCQSGVRAAQTYAVLLALGHPRPRLYLESWAEWGDLDHTPVSTAPPEEVIES